MSKKYGFSQPFIANKLCAKAIKTYSKELEVYFANLKTELQNIEQETLRLSRFEYDDKSFNRTEIDILAIMVHQIKYDSVLADAKGIYKYVLLEEYSYRQTYEAIRVFRSCGLLVENRYKVPTPYGKERVWTITNKGFDLVNQAIDQGYLK